MRILKASEVGSFVFCRRAWWYQRQGVRTLNTAELASGRRLHHRYGWRVFSASFLQRAAVTLLATAILLFGLYLYSQAA